MSTKPKGLTAEQVIAALRETHGNMSLAGKRLGVTRQAVAKWCADHPTVKQAHDEAASYVTDIAEGHLVNGVIKGDWDRVRYWLENKGRERGYGRAPQTNPLDGLTPEQVLAMTDDELDAFIDKHARAGTR